MLSYIWCKYLLNLSGKYMRKKLLLTGKILVGLCLLVAICYRFVLFGISYEYDELFTAVTSDPSLPFSWIWTNWLMIDVHPPLHNAFLWVYNHFAPYGPEVWLRLPSLFFGLGGLLCCWFMFPRRFGKSARLMFMALLSVNFYLLFYTQHARPYAMMFFFAAPLTFLFLKMSRAVWKGRKIKPMQWVMFGVLSLFLAWTHYFGTLLYGVFSLLLFFQALYYKRNITWFLIVPGTVFFLFLPWLLPNLLQNISLERFDGKWWMNERTFGGLMMGLRRFFFSPSPWAYLVLCLPLPIALWFRCVAWKKTGHFAYGREILLLLAVNALTFAIAGLMSFKLKLIMGRYFMELLPCFYLTIVLFVLPFLRKNVLPWIIGFAFLVLAMQSVHVAVRSFSFEGTFPARLSSSYYYRTAGDRDLFVVAIESFPPPSMNAMYGFYANKIFNMNRKVTELWQLSDEERESVLKQKDQAVIWMPNCNPVKLKMISEKWKRVIGVEKMLFGSCFLRIADEGETKPPAEWGETEQMKLSGIPAKVIR